MGTPFYGYKNHIKVDAKSKIIGTYYASDASVHDSQALGLLLTEKDKNQTLYADSAYTGSNRIWRFCDLVALLFVIFQKP